MDIDQQKYNKTMQEATDACRSAFRVREYLIRLAQEVRDDPVRREQVERWQEEAAKTVNAMYDMKSTFSHVYDVMLKWECEDKEYWDKREA